MKGSVWWSAVQAWAEFHLLRDSNPQPDDPKSEVLTTRPPDASPYIFKLDLLQGSVPHLNSVLPLKTPTKNFNIIFF